MSISKNLNIARGAFGVLAALFALITFILFGANMDYANFPGSNLKLAEHGAGDKEGQLVQLLGGWKLESVAISNDVGSGCSNFVEKASPADADTQLSPRDDSITLTFGGDVDGSELCKTTDDYDKNLNAGWNRGWVVAPECDRTTDENVCAPFGASSPLAWFGFLTFGTLAIQVVLYGAHTCVELTQDALNGNALTIANVKAFNRDAKIWLGLTIVWLIIGFALMVTSALAWDALCDKIDTGLGRQINTGTDASPDMVRACATTGCTMSFGSFFATFVVSIVWYRLPLIAQAFGFLESA